VPSLILIGDRDDFISVEKAVEMYRFIPQAELAMVAGIDHGLAFSRPADFIHIVLEFLLRHRVGASTIAADSE